MQKAGRLKTPRWYEMGALVGNELTLRFSDAFRG